MQARRLKCRRHLCVASLLGGCEFTGRVYKMQWGHMSHMHNQQGVSVTQQSSTAVQQRPRSKEKPKHCRAAQRGLHGRRQQRCRQASDAAQV
jgi:hypothetical protein